MQNPSKKHVLFVCTGNSCRSVMAEALFRKLTASLGQDIRCSSAGISAGDGYGPSLETLDVLDKEGIDMSGHKSRQLTQEIIDEASVIFVMEKIHHDWLKRHAPEAISKVHYLTEYASKENLNMTDGHGIPDPIRMSESFYRNVLLIIKDCVANIAKTI